MAGDRGRAYDAHVDLPSEREVRRAAVAVALGLALGLILLVFGRRARD